MDVIESSGESGSKRKIKHKQFSKRKRRSIYEKNKGHCYLCGESVDFNSFEVEHEIPLSKGGTNDLSNLYCSCHYCNMIKRNIYHDDFMRKVSQIFLYQMEMQSGDNLRWRIIHRELQRIASTL